MPIAIRFFAAFIVAVSLVTSVVAQTSGPQVDLGVNADLKAGGLLPTTAPGIATSRKIRSIRIRERILARIGSRQAAACRFRHRAMKARRSAFPMSSFAGSSRACRSPSRKHRGERSRALPDPARRADRGRAERHWRSPCHRARSRRLDAVRTLQRLPGRQGRLARRQRRDLGSEEEPGAARPLDLGRCRRPADPARPGALRRGRRRRARSSTRSASRWCENAPRLYPAGEPLGERDERRRSGADGHAGAPQGGLRHLRLLAGGARDPARR